MLFNSIEFLIFLPTTFILYWLLKDKIKWQNLFILAMSYIFYGWWDVRFLGLIVLSSVVDYTIGLYLHQSEKLSKRKLLLATSLVVNLGLLGFFKYYNFFVDSFVDAFSMLGITMNTSSLNIILPVGISFYTFQTLSYTIDIYRKKMQPTQNPIAFFAYVGFFPQLVAGPIERASNLLPQFFEKRTISPTLISDGLRQILWGMFKKIVIADNCAVIVDAVFSDYGSHNSTMLVVAAVLFAFQIYGDFSGYSDIAIGTAKLFGFKLMTNFSVPYFSLNVTDFWRRWHISMSAWFRDYVFDPLLFHYRDWGQKTLYAVTFVTFILIGFWHGGNWTFIVFGFLQALALSVEIATMKKRRKFKRSKSKWLRLYYLGSWLLNMLFWLVGCVIFRSYSIGDSWQYFKNIASSNFLQITHYQKDILILIPIIIITLVIEWYNRDKSHQLDIERLRPVFRHSIYLFLIALMFFFAKYSSNTFIYFQF